MGWESRTGTLWEGRYRSSLVQADRYALYCQRYIELNPVRAGMVAQAAAYEWSSRAIRDSSHKGWALGTTDFCEAMQRVTGRRARSLPKGPKVAEGRESRGAVERLGSDPIHGQGTARS